MESRRRLVEGKITKEQIELQGQIRLLVEQYFKNWKEEPFIPGKTVLPLCVPSFGYDEVMEAINSLLTTLVTMGDKVFQFERMFAEYIGVEHAIMFNSGSSANLVALAVLENPLLKDRIHPGDEIITPATTWATTVWPIINCGAVPVLVDVEPDTFNIDPGEIEKAITPRTAAIMPVHLLGRPCDMSRISDIAEEHNLFIVEDACEAHGAEWRGRKAGRMADMGTFSFFFTHHISTIEGGMITTDDDEFAELAKALRVFGWIRNLSNKNEIAAEHPWIDPRFLFSNIGYSLRPTEIQGAFGIHQMGKLDGFIEIRRDNAKFWGERLAKFSKYLWLHEEQKGTKHVWFGYPIIVNPDAPFTRKDIVDFLEAKGVETRPIMAGNMDEQPGMQLFPYRKVGDLPVSQLIMHYAFFFGNHPGIGEVEREAIAQYIEEFMAKVV